MVKKPNIIDARNKPTLSHSEKIVKAMEALRIDPTPENYAVWYHYFSGKKPLLSKDIANVRSQGLSFTPGVNRRLYEQYIQTDNGNEATKKINAAMKKLMAMLRQASTNADAYNLELGKKTDNLTSQIDSDPKIEGLIGEVVGQLKEIQETGNDFSSQIKDSQKEILELRENLEIATTEARIDDLTKLNNRRAFDELIEDKTVLADASETKLCMLMLDIDHFKTFNDRWGHQIGDEVLKIVAGVLKRTVRDQDIVARYGGEEFAVLLPETATDDAHLVAENIRKLIANNRLKRKDSKDDMGQITVSIGITEFKNQNDKETIEKFIKRADDALYNAKEKGRNRVSVK